MPRLTRERHNTAVTDGAVHPQTLKVIRYTSRLITSVAPPNSEVALRFDALQSSIGTSR
jgi:hypothetical protein